MSREEQMKGTTLVVTSPPFEEDEGYRQVEEMSYMNGVCLVEVQDEPVVVHEFLAQHRMDAELSGMGIFEDLDPSMLLMPDGNVFGTYHAKAPLGVDKYILGNAQFHEFCEDMLEKVPMAMVGVYTAYY